jgi:hypothetical protein
MADITWHSSSPFTAETPKPIPVVTCQDEQTAQPDSVQRAEHHSKAQHRVHETRSKQSKIKAKSAKQPAYGATNVNKKYWNKAGKSVVNIIGQVLTTVALNALMSGSR